MMVKRKRYRYGIKVDGKLVVFDGEQWEDLRIVAEKEARGIWM